MAYLVNNPPRVRQYRQRYAKPTGCIVVHTAENAIDSIGDGVDSSAENVASFIRTRSDYGSYHILVDSDSNIRLVPFKFAAYGDGTGSNEFAIHISFANRTTDWAKMSNDRKRKTIRRGAQGAARAARWVKKNYGIDIPTKKISKAASDLGKPGFLGHGDRDPSRRSDPGKDFPWNMFFDEFDRAMKRGKYAPTKPKRRPARIRKIIRVQKQQLKVANLAFNAAHGRKEDTLYYGHLIDNINTTLATARKIPKR